MRSRRRTEAMSFDVLYFGAAALYAAYALAEGLAPALRRPALALGLLLHGTGFVLRATAIGYFPLTNKFESFYAFSLAASAVCLAGLTSSPSRLHRLGTFAVGAAFYALTGLFDREVFFPPPLMLTVWYPLHVPLTFVAYALWMSAAAAGLALLTARTENGAMLRQIDRGLFGGFCAFSLSMIFGGAWGYVAWGAYFLWDPKVVWSVVLWLFYSGLLHLRYWPPASSPRLRAALALAGVPLVLVAYVGTSFLFGHGSHSFTSGRTP
jgi:ABC-type transport system involved in cytochrome c biogenesis permease subunit